MNQSTNIASIDLDAAQLDKLEALARAATPGPWEAKAISGSGLEIHMAHPQYPDKDWPAFGTSDAWCKKGLVAYETWVQFPNEVRDAAQARNATFIAEANPATVLQLIQLARKATSGSDKAACPYCPSKDGSHDSAYPHPRKDYTASGSDGAAAEHAEVPFRERFKDAYEALSIAQFNGPFWNQSMEQLLIAINTEIDKRAATRHPTALTVPAAGATCQPAATMYQPTGAVCQPLADERARFEAWAFPNLGKLTLDEKGFYAEPRVWTAWCAWDARAQQAGARAQPVATVVSRAGDDLRVGWLRPERCEVGTLLYAAPTPSAEEERDAKRLDYLDKFAVITTPSQSIRAAIDAAMASQSKPKEAK